MNDFLSRLTARAQQSRAQQSRTDTFVGPRRRSRFEQGGLAPANETANEIANETMMASTEDELTHAPHDSEAAADATVELGSRPQPAAGVLEYEQRHSPRFTPATTELDGEPRPTPRSSQLGRETQAQQPSTVSKEQTPSAPDRDPLTRVVRAREARDISQPATPTTPAERRFVSSQPIAKEALAQTPTPSLGAKQPTRQPRAADPETGGRGLRGDIDSLTPTPRMDSRDARTRRSSETAPAVVEPSSLPSSPAVVLGPTARALRSDEPTTPGQIVVRPRRKLDLPADHLPGAEEPRRSPAAAAPPSLDIGRPAVARSAVAPTGIETAPGRDNVPQQQPIIRVSIGRVEVRAMNPPQMAPPQRARATRPKTSLDDYLHQRQEARRR